jgi:hypothetical protein
VGDVAEAVDHLLGDQPEPFSRGSRW